MRNAHLFATLSFTHMLAMGCGSAMTVADPRAPTAPAEVTAPAAAPAEPAPTAAPPSDAAAQPQAHDDEEDRREQAAMASVTATMDKLASSPRIDEDKVDCTKQDQLTDADMKAHRDSPLQAIADKAATMCTLVQHIYQEARPGSGPPKATKVDGLGRDSVVALATQSWESGDDAGFVQVLGGRVTGGGWSLLYTADAKGVPSSRLTDVVHAIRYRSKCFLVHGQVVEKNLNHPSADRPAAWSAPELRITTSETLDCRKATL